MKITFPKRYVNLTPHDVNVIVRDKVIATYEGTSSPARVDMVDVPVGHMDVNGHQVAIVRPSFGALQNVPEPIDGTMFIVSLITAQAMLAAGRKDALIVHNTVRDGSTILGCRAFAKP